MSLLSQNLKPGALLSGAERKVLRETLLAATDRERLTTALGEADPSRDFDHLVPDTDFASQLGALIGRAEQEGWLTQLIDIFAGMTDREDLLHVARHLGAEVERRKSRRWPLPPPPRRLWPLLGAAALAAAAAGWWFWPGAVPGPGSNFKIRIVEDVDPLPSQPVAIWKWLPDGSKGAPVERVTNTLGEAFFVVTYGTFYGGEARVRSASGERLCEFPGFMPTDSARDFVQNVHQNFCHIGTAPERVAFRSVSQDAFFRTRGLSPEAPAAVAPIESEPVLALPPLPFDTDDRVRSARAEDGLSERAPLGLPGAPIVLDRLSYTLGFDPGLRLALWAAFTIDAAKVQATDPSPGVWRPDPDIPDRAQTGPDAYMQTVYVRGRLVRRLDGQKAGLPDESERLNRELWYHSVAIPQPGATNEITWAAVEEAGSELSRDLGPIHTVAGPVFPDFEAPNLPILVIGPDQTPIPVAIFRVHLRRTAAGAWRSVAFLVPNDGSQERDPSVFLTSVAEVEAATGLTFFPDLREDVAANVKAQADLDLFRQD